MSKVSKSFNMFLTKNGSKILIGASVVTMASAIVMGIKSHTKYEILMVEAKDELEDEEEISKKTKMKTFVKAYWPTIILAVCSASCTIGSHYINQKHQAALTMSNKALNEFQKKTIEHIGEKKVTEIKDKIAKDKIEAKKPEENKIIITPSNGKVLFFDDYSGRYFYSDVETIKRVVNNLNRKLPEEMYITLNELYVELGIPEIELGDQLGWHLDNCTGFEESLSAQITDNGEPCIVVSYDPTPDPTGWFHDKY
jgi:hypothetical protein